MKVVSPVSRWRGGGGGGDQAWLGPAAGGHTHPAAGPQAGRPPLPLPGECCPHLLFIHPLPARVMIR